MKKILLPTLILAIVLNCYSENQGFNNVDIANEDVTVSDENENDNDKDNDTYIPLISENKVWKYVFVGGATDDEYEPVKGFIINIESRFDGKVEFDGVEYHVLKTIDTSTQEEENKILFPNFYMREESRKVYLYLKGPNYTSPNGYLVYDFSLNVGDRADLIGGAIHASGSDVENFNHYPYWIFYLPWHAKVLKIEMIDVAGQSCKKYTIVNEPLPQGRDEGYEYSYIEGVGSVKCDTGLKKNDEGDFLAFFNRNLYMEAEHMYAPYRFYLIGVYDTEDNVIYKGEMNPVSGIDQLSDGDANISCHSEYFNLQGFKVTAPERGQMYIERNGSQTRKVLWQ